MMKYLTLSLAVLVAVLGLSTWSYRTQFKATSYALKTQNEAIDAKNKEAEETLKRVTAERDTLQAEKNKRAAAQEKQGEQAKTDIAAISKRDADTPVSVRYITRYARSCDPRETGGGTAPAVPGSGDAQASSGVLDPEAQRLFAGDKQGIEQLQAAFNLCKDRLIPEGK
jgi:hypothetical protein